MDYSVTFARHFSRLVWLLLHEPANVDEQKAALRAVNTVSKDGAVRLATHDWRLVVNGAPLPEALTGVQDLAAQLIGHAVAEVVFGKGTPPGELLGVARILAAEPTPGDGGVAIQEKFVSLGAANVTAAVRGVESLMRATPIGMPAMPPAPVPPPARPAHTAPAAPPSDAAALDGDLGLPDLLDEEETRPLLHPATPLPIPDAAPIAPPARAAAAGAPDPRRSGAIAPPEEGGMFLSFSAAQAPSGPLSDLLGQLDATRSVNTTTRVLDELVTTAENAQREGKNDIAADVFHGIIVREANAGEGDLKRAYVMAVRRLSKPTILRAVAQLLPRRREHLDRYLQVLVRTGEDGADAIIEQLTNSSSLAERRVYFDALLKLNSGVPALIHMLGDARWYVARNAADLLGEMQAPGAEQPLIDLCKHDDDRVRRAATHALAKLGTPRALGALHAALRDTSAQVRLQAVSGLATRKGEKSAITVTKALDDEVDPEVQLAILAALGRLGTADAVQKLIKAAESEGRFFKKKSVAYRIAAVQALGEARTAAALAALQTLARDKEKDVSDAVVRALVSQQAAPRAAAE